MRATVRNPALAQSLARGTSFLPCPFSGANSVCSGSASLSFQGPPGCCHLICRLLAHCWQRPGPLPHPEQEEQHLLLLDCCLVLLPDLYICVCAAARGGALWCGGCLSDVESCLAGSGDSPPPHPCVLGGCGSLGGSHLHPQCCPLPGLLCLWEAGPCGLEGPCSLPDAFSTSK